MKFSYFLCAVLGLALLPSLSGAEPIFSKNGKSYSRENLSVKFQQKLFDIESQRFYAVKELINESLVETYIKERAEADKKTFSEAEAIVFAEAQIDDKKAKEWYDKNEGRRGPQPFEEIKGQIISFLSQEKRDELKKNLIKKLKTESVQILYPEPTIAAVEIVSDGFPSIGGKNAKNNIVIMSDLICRYCLDKIKKIVDVAKNNATTTRVVIIPIHAGNGGLSTALARGAVCADGQGKFWAYLDEVMKGQELSLGKETDLAKAVKEMDVDKFTTCVASEATKTRVIAASKRAEDLGVDLQNRGNVPAAVFLNGKRLSFIDPDLVTEVERRVAVMH